MLHFFFIRIITHAASDDATKYELITNDRTDAEMSAGSFELSPPQCSRIPALCFLLND